MNKAGSSWSMQAFNLARPLVDRPLDPLSESRVKAPGVGAVIAFQSDAESVLREAKDVGKARGRIVYAILVINEASQMLESRAKWLEDITRLCYSEGVEWIELPSSNLIPGLEDYCRSFDIRLLVVEADSGRGGLHPWRVLGLERLAHADGLPPTYIIRPERDSRRKGALSRIPREWIAFSATVGGAWILTYATRHVLSDSLQLLIFVFAVSFLATRVHILISLAGCVLSSLAFVVVHFTNPVETTLDPNLVWLDMVGLLLVSTIISLLTWQGKTALAMAQIQERRKSSVLHLTNELLRLSSIDDIADLMDRHIREEFRSSVAVFLLKAGRVDSYGASSNDLIISEPDIKARESALTARLPAGRGTQTHPLAFGVYLPIHNLTDLSACVGIYPADRNAAILSEHLRLLDTYAGLLGTALDRVRYEESRTEAERKIRDANLQNTLLRSMSHDLKTPLTSITGFANQLAEEPNMPADERVRMYIAVRDEAWRLNTLVSNLMSLTKLESGALQLSQEPMFVEELIGTAVGQLRHRTAGHVIKVEVPGNLPDVLVDPMLINQAIVNLLENATKYCPLGTTITVTARNINDQVVISILDEGPGLPEGSLEKVFEKFVRLVEGSAAGGTGLGLAIVKSIVELHRGRVKASNRPEGGARFDLMLPIYDPKNDRTPEE